MVKQMPNSMLNNDEILGGRYAVKVRMNREARYGVSELLAEARTERLNDEREALNSAAIQVQMRRSKRRNRQTTRRKPLLGHHLRHIEPHRHGQTYRQQCHFRHLHPDPGRAYALAEKRVRQTVCLVKRHPKK